MPITNQKTSFQLRLNRNVNSNNYNTIYLKFATVIAVKLIKLTIQQYI